MPDERAKDPERTVQGGAPVYVVQRRSRPLLLRQVKGAGMPREVRLELDELIVGRSGDAQLSIDSGAVSRRHAALRRSGDHYLFVDLDSSNGIYVNGTRVTSTELHDGDMLQIGDTLFLVVATESTL
ncbi:MAG TPA: FHA domain-containing protein [Polyangiaceae bacterium]|nr:FHA domain-containing protein [Polyangiaceae bacterium]